MLAATQADNPLLILSVVLVAGIAGGMASRRLHLPAVTGQIVVGVLLGRIGLISADSLHALRPLIDFALGLMAVAVGSHLVWAKLRNARKRLALLLLLEAALTPVLVYLATLWYPGTTWQLRLLMATIAISTAPATVLALVKETRSRGAFVKTLLAATALNNLACIALFEIAHAATRTSLEPGASHTLGTLALGPLWELVRAAVLGAVAGGALILSTRRVVRPDRLAAVSLVAILLTVGLAEAAGISALLACLFLGLTLANLTPDREEVGAQVFANFEYAIFAVFFTVAGLELRLDAFVAGGLLSVVLFAARFAGKFGAARLAMRAAGATERMRRYLGIALIPQAGLAVGLMLLVTEDPVFGSMRDLFLAVILGVVLMNELVGPILCRLALQRSGDFGMDRRRLIDFLQEEHIVTGLRAATARAAIEQLTDHLLRTNQLAVDREELLRGILEREAQAPTALGKGLAIPHGPLAGGHEILGVMGLSADGLPFPTPDGRPVQCIVLMLTPPEERDRHLEVLAAFAQVIGDRQIRRELYHAKSPAHAYELLHAEEESEEYNYFLDDE